jgi:hypothetical protein
MVRVRIFAWSNGRIINYDPFELLFSFNAIKSFFDPILVLLVHKYISMAYLLFSYYRWSLTIIVIWFDLVVSVFNQINFIYYGFTFTIFKKCSLSVFDHHKSINCSHLKSVPAADRRQRNYRLESKHATIVSK